MTKTLGELFMAVYRGENVSPDDLTPSLRRGIRRLADRCAQEARQKYRLAEYLVTELVLDENLSRARREAMAASVVEERLERLLVN